MAHEIENEMIAYANELPWHGIGTELKPDASPEEFLKAAKLDWELEKRPMFADLGDDHEPVAVPGRYALVRSTDHKVMAVTGSSWKPLQNRDALDFMTRYVNAGGATMETAGGLRDGKIVWGLARLNHEFQVRPGDRVKGYLLITSPHVVGQAITIKTTTVRVVCANTMALSNAKGMSEVHYRQSHLSEFDVDAAREAVAAAHEQLAEAERRAKVIDKLKISAEDAVRKVLLPVFEPEALSSEEVMNGTLNVDVLPKKIQQILNSVENAPGGREVAGTGWGVLNGVTHWTDHVAGNSRSTRMHRSWLGDYSRMKLEVERKLLELAA